MHELVTMSRRETGAALSSMRSAAVPARAGPDRRPARLRRARRRLRRTRPRRRAGRRRAAAGQRRARRAARGAGARSSAAASKRPSTVELRARVAGALDKVHFREGATGRRRASCCSRSTPGPSRPRWRAREAQLRRPHAGRAQQERAGARREAAADPGRVASRRSTSCAPASRNAESAIQGAEAALAQARLNLEFTPHHRAGLGPHLARQHHAGQPRRRGRAGAHHDRLQRQGLCLLRRQRSDLPQVCEGGARRHRPRARSRTGADGPRQRGGLPAQGPDGLRRQPAQSGHGVDPRPRGVRQQRRPLHAGPVRPHQADRLAARYQATLVPDRAITTDQTRKMVLRGRREQHRAAARGQARRADRRHARGRGGSSPASW